MVALFFIILAMMFIGVGNTFKIVGALLFAAVGAFTLYFLGYTLLLTLLA